MQIFLDDGELVIVPMYALVKCSGYELLKFTTAQ
jgi:hypothetical protein